MFFDETHFSKLEKKAIIIMSVTPAICRSSLVATTGTLLSASQLRFIHGFCHVKMIHGSTLSKPVQQAWSLAHSLQVPAFINHVSYVLICFYGRISYCLCLSPYSAASSPGVFDRLRFNAFYCSAQRHCTPSQWILNGDFKS